MEAKYLIILTAYYGDTTIKVFENEDLKTKFDAIVKRIEEDSYSNITFIHVWDIEMAKWKEDYVFDRSFVVRNAEHNRYLDHLLDIGKIVHDDDSDHAVYDEYGPR